jgi:predicted nucleic acid-binding protein
MVFAYFDTCVWLSAFSSKDLNHDKAVKLFERVKEGQYVVLVSHHVLNEILDVLKKRAVITAREEQKAEELTREKYREFSRVLLTLINVRIKNPYVSTHQVLRRSFSLLCRYMKGISHSDTCPICGTEYNYVNSDTIFEGDALHVLIAWNLNCDIFFTFDKDFKQLIDDNSLRPMQVKILN